MDLIALGSVIAVLGAAVAVLLPALNLQHDAREPPLLRPTVPLIGHVLNLMRYSVSYYTRLRQKHPNLDIYTLNLYSIEVYVVNTLALTSAVQRQAKVITFDPLLEQTFELLAGLSEDGLRKHRKPGVAARMLKSLHSGMVPGPALDEMTRSMCIDVSNSVNALIHEDASRAHMDLYQWTWKTIGVASTNAVWGRENNPFAAATPLEALGSVFCSVRESNV